MTTPHRLTDRASLDRFRSRAENADFLLEEAAFELHERLIDVNRSFQNILIVTGQPNFWLSQFPQATVIEDTELLNVTPQTYDLAIHAMALHWADDPVGQLVQCRHALKPDGLFLSASFAGQTLNELRSSLGDAEIQLTGGLSPRIAPMGEIRDLGGLLQRAGFALPVADSLVKEVHYSDALSLMKDLRAMGESNALAQRHRKTPPKALFALASALYAENFPAPEGRITATFELVFLTGWAPSETQPKALRPGSATTRLADALGTIEFTENTPPKLDDPK